MAAKNETQLDYFMDVIMRNYCRVCEELDLSYYEIDDLKSAMFTLFEENSELRFIVQEAGLKLPESCFDFEPEENCSDSECTCQSEKIEDLTN